MSWRLILLPAAAADASEARDWYEKRRETLGTEFGIEVDAALTQIAANPEFHPAEFRGVRRALVRRFPYIVYYRIADDAIHVLAILHAKRHPRVWRSRARDA